MSLTLSKKGRAFKLYKYTYGLTPPYDFCKFFWEEVIALVLFPFTVLSYWCKPRGNKSRFFIERLAYSFMFSLVIAFVVSFGFLFYHVPKEGLIAVVVGLGIIGLLFFAENAQTLLTKVASKLRLQTPEVFQILHTKTDSIKNKYCPKITWK